MHYFCEGLNVVLPLERNYGVRRCDIACVWLTVVVTPRLIITESVTYRIGTDYLEKS